MNLPERFELQLQNSKLILPGDKVYVACSGGPDSVALFLLLVSLQSKWRLKLGLLHFNHGLRGRESDRDEQFVKNLSKKFKVPVVSRKTNNFLKLKSKKESMEEAGRRLRYDFLLKTAKRRRMMKVGLAHTQDDQAETVLMRILQGTGLRGLSGIRSRLEMGGVSFVRPLLEFRKKEILHFLATRKMAFRTDRSNLSEKFVRNRIRHKLLPWLEKEFNPRVVPALARLPMIVKEENGLMQEMERKAWKQVFNRNFNRRIYLKRRVFLNLPSPLQFRILLRAMQKLDPKSGLGFEGWQRLRYRLQRVPYRHSLPGDIDLLITPSKIKVCNKIAQA